VAITERDRWYAVRLDASMVVRLLEYPRLQLLYSTSHSLRAFHSLSTVGFFPSRVLREFPSYATLYLASSLVTTAPGSLRIASFPF